MHKKFNYKTIQNLQDDINRLELDLGTSEDLSILLKPVQLGKHIIPNSMVAHPMEGGDADSQGAPTDLTFRKYEAAARGGVGLIWLESVTINEEGRSNKGQLFIKDETLQGFKELVRRINEGAKDSPIAPHKPITILQLNHSGRYSKPEGPPASKPIIASHMPELDERLKIDDTYPIVSDEYLEGLTGQFVKASVLAKEAGFNGVDIKACHGYLLHELFACFDRAGKYGGSYENRTGLFMEIIDKVKEAVNDPDFIISVRINMYDALTVSKGWGTDLSDFSKIDLKEPIRLVKELAARGVELVNVTMGNPAFLPHISRPYDMGVYYPEESPLEGVYRLIHYTRELQSAVPEAKIVGVGYSWLRELSPYVAAWVLKTGGASLIGWGRMFIAYPDFAKDIMEKGKLQKNKVCVTCSKCSFLRRDTGLSGCVIRDTEGYMKFYQKAYGKDES
ncbi:MAG: flavin oxidoreductase/NADH oxidase [Defluviitaleaceae bacterium]|nr:flavin oxidoreductase/NADH oxidase [Defluviitaleaceae bacterium]